MARCQAAGRESRREGTIIKRELKNAADKAADKAAGKAEEVIKSRPLEVLARGGFAVSGAFHLLVGLIAFGVARGSIGRADVSGAVGGLAHQPAGLLLRGIRRSFQKYLNLPPSPAGHKAITALGIAGYVAKGAALFVTGLSALIATVTVHPEQAGLDNALHALRDQPYGTYVVSAVGSGLSCYGLFTIVRAHLAKM